MTTSRKIAKINELSPKLQMCVWDLDGTAIINNEATALDQIGRVFREHIKDNHGYADEFCYRVYAGMPLPKIRASVEKRLQHLNICLPDTIDKTILELRAVSPHKGERLVVHPFFKTLMGTFKKQGVYQCIATGSEPDRAARYVMAASLRKYFSPDIPYLFSGHKPEPDCYFEAMSSYTPTRSTEVILDNRRIISFEDSLSGVKAGVAAGVQVIGHVLASHIAERRKDDIAQSMLDAGAIDVIRYDEQAYDVLIHVLENRIPATSVLLRPSRSTKTETDTPLFQAGLRAPAPA